ncbi:hypothetical protein DFS34DRAFT_598034 [Phlyctochytrium arcticum]|nr:hypothetical protein DFS34DRAFT_598034 [Phlyctochytrium arcticum]
MVPIRKCWRLTYYTTYVAGNNISTSGATISCTKPGGNGITVAGKTISNGMVLTASTGIIVTPVPNGYSISSIDTYRQEERKENDPVEETKEGDTLKSYKSGAGDVVSISGGLTGVLGRLLGILGGLSYTLSLGPLGGAEKVLGESQIDFGFNSVTPNIIQSNHSGTILRIKNRAANGYSEIKFFNNNETVQPASCLGNTSTPAPHKDVLYLQCSSLFLDGPKGGELTRPVAAHIWDNVSWPATGAVASFSKRFTTTRTVQMYNGSISLYSNPETTDRCISSSGWSSCQNAVPLLEIRGANHTLPSAFITTGLSLGNTTHSRLHGLGSMCLLTEIAELICRCWSSSGVMPPHDISSRES